MGNWVLKYTQDIRLQYTIYSKVPKFSDAQKIGCNLPKNQTKGPNLRVFHQKDVNGIANSEDPEDPLGAVRSGSALFAQTYLSENLGFFFNPRSSKKLAQ